NDYFSGVYSASVLFGAGAGSFQPVQHYNLETKGRAIAAGDLNGDGRDDLVVAGYVSTGHCSANKTVVASLLAQLNGTMLPGFGYSDAFNSPGAITLGDFNSDGRLDYAVADTISYKDNDTTCGASTVETALGNGDGSFQDAVSLSVGSTPKA